MLLTSPDERIPRTEISLADVLRRLDECASREWSEFSAAHKQNNQQQNSSNSKSVQCRVEPIDGCGYLSCIWRLCFSYSSSNGHQQEEEFRAVIKCPNPKHVAEVNMIDSKEELDPFLALLVQFHGREVHFYAELVPKFLVDSDFAVTMLPRCFGWQLCADVKGLEAAFLVLEDLSDRGTHPTEADNLSRAQVEAVIRAMAQLHALSLAMPAQCLDTLRLAQTHSFRLPADQIVRRLCVPGKACTQFFQQHRPALEKFIAEVLGRQEDICAEFDIRPVLTHGDLWSNNLLFSRQSPDRLAAVLDWQFARPDTGLNDLAHLLLGSVDVALRRQCQEQWLRLYRAEMAQWARHIGQQELPIGSDELAEKLFRKHMPKEVYFQMQMLALNEDAGEKGEPAERRQTRLQEMFSELLLIFKEK